MRGLATLLFLFNLAVVVPFFECKPVDATINAGEGVGDYKTQSESSTKASIVPRSIFFL